MSVGVPFQDVIRFGLEFFGFSVHAVVVVVECALIVGDCRMALGLNLAYVFMGVEIYDSA